MTDDEDAAAREDAGELRSRIEAQVAARRNLSKGDAERDEQERAPRGPRSLAPSRRWGRTETDLPEDAESAAPAEGDDEQSARQPTRGGSRRPGVEPARPWAGQPDDESSDEEVPEPEPPANARGRERLKPARRWGRAALPEPAGEEADVHTPAPSKPDTVLRGLEAEAAIASGSASAEDFDPDVLPRADTETRRRRFARRTEEERADAQLAAERVAQQHLDELRRETERIEAAQAEAQRLAREHREAAERLAAERAAAEEQLDERRREAERVEARRVQMEQIVEEHRQEAERLEAERLAAEQQVAAELAAKRAEAAEVEARRVAAESLIEERRRQVEEIEARRAAAESLIEQRRRDVEEIEARRAAAEQLVEQRRQEAERLAAEQAEAERLIAQRRAELARLDAERAEAERLVAAQREEALRAEAERRAEAEQLSAQPAPPAEHVVPIAAERRRRLGRRTHAGQPEPAAEPVPTDALTPVDESSPAADEETARLGYVPDDEAISAYAEAAALTVPDERPASEDAPAAADVPLEPAAAAGSGYPWQGADDVDLDLQGAPTWDPAMYPPQSEGDSEHRTRRALRWLFARTPDDEPLGREPAARRDEPQAGAQEAEPAAAQAPEPVAEPEAEPVLEPALELEAGSPALVDLELAEALPVEPAPEPADVEQPAAQLGADAEEPEQVAEPAAERESVLSRMLGRRREREPEPAEADDSPHFPLPAPDAAFEQPWARSPEPPRPTRDWSKPATPAEQPVEPAEREPAFAAAEADAAPTPVRRPTPGAAPSGRRPSPGAPAASRRPSPGAPSGGPRPSPAASAAAPKPLRPTPGTGPARKPMPFELAAAGGASALTGRPTPGARSRRPAPGSPPPPATAERSADEDDEDDRGRGSDGGSGWRRFGTRTLVIVVIAGLAAVLLRTFVVQPYYIPSESMEPTLHGCPTCNDDHVLIDKISYRFGDPKAGDIVVFHRPKDAQVSDKVLIKRVIGLPHDRISMTRGQVFVNGKAITEKYLNSDHGCYATSPDETFKPRTVPSGEVFVMGDNRCNSTDSRSFGPIKISSIIGRAFAIIWPVHRISWLG